MQERKLMRSAADSISRRAETRADVATSVDTKSVSRHMNALSKPSSPGSTLRKAGVALIVAAPDPFSDVAGAALVATSYAMKGKEPTKLDDIAAETRRILREIHSLRL